MRQSARPRRTSLTVVGKAGNVKLSARNLIPGTVKQIIVGSVNDEVVVELAGGQELVSVITKSSVENLGLKKGSKVYAVIKASNIILAVD